MFGKKNKPGDKNPAVRPIVSPKVVEQIQIIPNRFFSSQKKKNNKIFIIIGVSVIFIGLIIVSVMVAYKLMSGPEEYQEAAIEANDRQQETSPVVADVDINNNISIVPVDPDEITINENINAAPVFDEPKPGEPIPPDEEPLPVPTDPQSGKEDIDNDKLTLNEEKLYGTDPDNPDTDGDGYLDGDEILAGYNPIGGGSLRDSGLIIQYRNEQYGFSIWYPQKWITEILPNPLGAAVTFDSKIGEFIVLIYDANSENLSLRNFILKNYPAIEVDDLQSDSLPGFAVLADREKLHYFLKPDYSNAVFYLKYDHDYRRGFSFATTYRMMLKNLEILK